MKISLPSNAVVSGSLVELGMCPSHGNPPVKTRQREFVTKTPGWVYLLIPVGILIAAIVQLALQKKVKGPVPECARCRSRRHAYSLALLGLWLGVLVSLVAALVESNGVLVVLMALVFVAAAVLTFSSSRFVLKGSLSKDLLWVELHPVDERFALAVQARMAEAAAPVTPLV